MLDFQWRVHHQRHLTKHLLQAKLYRNYEKKSVYQHRAFHHHDLQFAEPFLCSVGHEFVGVEALVDEFLLASVTASQSDPPKVQLSKPSQLRSNVLTVLGENDPCRA